MTQAPQPISLKAIRELLLSYFNPGDLDDLFASAEIAELRAACDHYLPGDSLPTKVRRALVYCERHNLHHELLAEIGRARPELILSLRAQFRGATALVLGLPANLTTFTGRPAEIREIRCQLRQQGIAVISGVGGVGKTALAVHVAHQLAAEGRFRDAQLYIDLKGRDSAPADAVDALASLVNTVAGRDPSRAYDLDTLGSLWRQTADGLEAIVILDNAADAEQVRLLLPGCSTCAVLVTSRQRFTLPDAGSLALRRMDREEACKLLQLLAPRLEDGEADAIAGLCGDLPLALQVAGGYLQLNEDCLPHRYAWMLVDERTRRKRRCDPDDHNLDVAAAISLSIARLDADPRRAWSLRRGWALLSLFPAPFDLPAAAVLWNELRHVSQVLELLQTLCHHGLVTYDSELGCYSLHDLSRLAAAEELEHLRIQVAEAARLRLAGYYGDAVWSDELLQGAIGAMQGPTIFDRQWPHIRAGQAWAAARAGAYDSAALVCVLYAKRTARFLTRRLHRATTLPGSRPQRVLRAARPFPGAKGICRRTM